MAGELKKLGIIITAKQPAPGFFCIKGAVLQPNGAYSCDHQTLPKKTNFPPTVRNNCFAQNWKRAAGFLLSHSVFPKLCRPKLCQAGVQPKPLCSAQFCSCVQFCSSFPSRNPTGTVCAEICWSVLKRCWSYRGEDAGIDAHPRGRKIQCAVQC
jgi:hypothetical protein